MASSQNGWQAFADYGDANLVSNPVIPGTNNVKIYGGLRKGDVATVLLYVAQKFHQNVEPLTQDAGQWGFGPRNIRGSSTTLSNHASGTAVDLNASRHSLGSSGTFSAVQVVRIVALLAELGGVVRWGGHYSGRKDEMHFEINAGASEVAAVAARIRGGSQPKPPVTTPPTTTPKPPTTGGNKGIIPADTSFWHKGWRKPGFPLPAGYYFGPKEGPAQSLSGMTSTSAKWKPQVVLIQNYLVAAGFLSGARDGLYGPGTQAAVKKFQQRYNGPSGKLAADGLTGRRTWEAMALRTK